MGKVANTLTNRFLECLNTLMSFILSDVLKKIGKVDSDLIVKSLNYVDLNNVLSFAYWLNHEGVVHGRLASNENLKTNNL